MFFDDSSDGSDRSDYMETRLKTLSKVQKSSLISTEYVDKLPLNRFAFLFRFSAAVLNARIDFFLVYLF